MIIVSQKKLNDFKFIHEIKESIHWIDISYSKKLSEDFIREFKDNVIWNIISISQQLSEDFIREFKDKVWWNLISRYQKLSENFIREFKDYVDWYNISVYQKLSENFIREFKDNVDWNSISEYQQLSEDFIIEFKSNVNYRNILISQKISEILRDEINLFLKDLDWSNKSKEFKLNYIKNNTNYEVIDDEYIFAYKSTKFNGKSVYKPDSYVYIIGQTYISDCDCVHDEESSFGLSAWYKENAIKYCNEELYLVKIFIDDIGCITKENNKIRARKLTVIEKIK